MANEQDVAVISESLKRKLKRYQPDFGYDPAELTLILTVSDTRVYFAERYDNEEKFAVKIIEFISSPAQRIRDIEEYVDRYSTVSRLRHPNLVEHFGLKMATQEHARAELHVFMEYCSGGTLFHRSQSAGGLKVPDIMRYATEVISGLAYLHNNRICHRDLKGTNILLTADDTVKIGGFGDIVKLLSASKEGEREVGRRVGTLGYIAPEMIDPDCGQSGRASDIYSFGCVLIEMLTGNTPKFKTKAGVYLRHGYEIMRFVATGGAPVIPATAEDIDSLIRSCIQHDPQIRPTALQIDETLASMTESLNSPRAVAARREASDAETSRARRISLLLNELSKSVKPAPNYTIQKLIGRGTDCVYGGIEHNESNPVSSGGGQENFHFAVKETKLASGVTHEDQNDMEALRSDLQKHVNRFHAIQNLKHENIVKCISLAFKVNDEKHVAVHLLMEHCSGGNLFEKSQPNGLGVVGTIGYAVQIISGLKFLHEHHICHLNIKGANILLTASGIVKIGGFSKCVMDVNKRPDAVPMNVGSVRYMAPELINPDLVSGKRGTPADIYSFGCVIIEMLTGKVPQFQHRSGQVLNRDSEIRFHVGTGNPPVIPKVEHCEYELLYNLVTQCLANDPDQRLTAGAISELPFLTSEARKLDTKPFRQSRTSDETSIRPIPQLEKTFTKPVEVLSGLAQTSIPLFAGMLADCMVSVTDGVSISKRYQKSREKRAAAIQRSFGDSFPEQLLQIEEVINDGFARCGTVSMLVRIYVVRSKLDKIKEMRRYYDELNPRHHSRARERFLDYVAAHDPMDLADLLYERITEPGDMSQSGRSLLDEMLLTCDIDQFKECQTDIQLMMIQAFVLKTLYHKCRSETCTRRDTSQELQAALDMESMVALDMESMANYARVLPEKFSDKLTELKLNLLLKPEADSLKEHCKEGERNSCQIGLELEKVLKNEQAMSNKQLDGYVCGILQKKYPHFVWAAAVVDNYKDVEWHYDADVYVHRFGSRQVDASPVQGVLRKVKGDDVSKEREDRVVNPGKGTYGHFLCYRERNRRKSKAVLAVWMDPDALSEQTENGMCGKLIDKWENNVRFRESCSGKSGSTMQLIQELRSMGMSYVFAVGLGGVPEKNDELEQTFGFSPTHLSGLTTFPLLLGSVLIWPKALPIAPPAPKDTLLIDEKLTEKLRVGTHYGMYRSQLMVDDGALNVAIKEIPLTIGSDEQSEQDRRRQIELLDSHMGFQFTQPNLSHDNVVKYFGFTVFTPNPLFKHGMDKLPSYRMIMEFLEGETLSQWVARNPINLANIHDWGSDILSALVYLHAEKVVHKDIQGDHVMFEGPGATGKLKLVSFGRIASILNETSLRPADRPFQPDGDVDRGARTDVWSFGCLLIQMITGHPPVLESKNTGDQNSTKSRKIPKIPDDPNLPVSLLGVLKQCFVLHYYDRFYAHQVKEMKFFANDEYKSSQWERPAARGSPNMQ